MGLFKKKDPIVEVEKAVVGKREVIEKILMALLADGHVLLDDIPGVGKTTLAVALSRTLGLTYHRIQFTPDVLPSDIVGFSIYNKDSGCFEYKSGVVSNTNLLLGDEINRTSSKTQSALLEAMEERQVTVDGMTYPLQKPFAVIATQNNVGTAGTQLLPYAQMDRFLFRLSADILILSFSHLPSGSFPVYAISGLLCDIYNPKTTRYYFLPHMQSTMRSAD